MASAKLRRVFLPTLDRRVARASMQIYSATAMTGMYISRADIEEQWIVVSNPSAYDIDLSGYTLANENGTRIFRFPRHYIIFAGEETTVWCTPGATAFNPRALREPYLLWTQPNGSLAHTPFFNHKDAQHDVLLLDPYLSEVASLQITASGHKTFRVRQCRAPADGAYVFARYSNVASDASSLAHVVAVVITPVLEMGRLWLLMTLLLQVHWVPASTEPHLLVYAFVCDIAARVASLFLQHASLASFLAQTSMGIDQLHVVVVYLALSTAYPAISIFRTLMTAELTANFVGLLGADRVAQQSRWHPMHMMLEGAIYIHPLIFAGCYLAKESLVYMLFLKATLPSTTIAMHALIYLCVPLFAVSTAISIARGATVALHLADLTLARLRYGPP
ncbi:hypothetical protein SPRG_18811 [Saprolegnia parasitica CBS 223.65]|uniref:LTD domain-containing protein n=1 Tax=Saprolegnia parasitica (strain CBS 223.65) TaxID=695850 RepID=A0A067CYT5_SAPPC|nr:hypothetical protein SPRG_18811 [Saprolegnia parasitica CBS 223.65]KDO35648.1 hypothetical protein SPRG_18811 [Saprolegnia parasitica CBS 223.65]|eukprot:XP_012194028.1 hypothetical protein SPRG_18811 [Saprolegnia parasitica CBS 223.65]